jgi:hypothetical protein
MNRAVTVIRVIFGIHFHFNGLNFFFHFMTIPLPHNPVAVNFVRALNDTGIVFNAVKVIEVGTGLALLANRFVPLALVIALPVSLNIFFVDVFLIGTWFGGWVLGAGTLLLNAILLFSYLKYYRPMLSMRAQPALA